jgi:hypothetical protein
VLPLADDDGQNVTMVIGATIYAPLPEGPGSPQRREGMTRFLIPLTE